ncbi:MAG: hypothetical protein AAF212_02200 [Verrucomicrobiota bacterium]
MKKLLLGLFLFFAIGLTAIVIAGWVFLGTMIREGVNAIGPQLTQTTFSVQDVSVSPLSGNASIQGLVVGNPKGYSGEKAVGLDEISIDLDIASLFDEGPIRIRRIYLKAPSVAYEKSLRSSNIADIQKNIQAASERFKSAPATSKETPSDPESAEIRLAIDEVIIEDGSVGLSIGGRNLSLPLPSITLRDLGTEDPNGMGPSEALAEIVSALVKGVGTSVADAGRKAITDGTISIEAITDGVKNIFGGKE